MEAANLPSGIDTLHKFAQRKEGPQILDTDAYSAIFRTMCNTPFYRSSVYRPDLPAGVSVQPSVDNVDLMDMPFPDAMFDVILTSDVMEHVRRDDAAHAEIYRCLKAGGCYVFTVPFVPEWEHDQIRVDGSGEKDVFLMEPEYHKDPLNIKGALVYRIYGAELITKLERIGFDVKFDNSPIHKLGMPVRDVFVCRKL